MKINMKCVVNESVIRFALFALNFIFSILSIVLVALGIVYIENVWWPSDFESLNFIKLPILLIVLGCFSFLTSIGGCISARSNNRRYLHIFTVILVIILALELTVAFIAFSNMDVNKENKTRSIVAKEFRVENFAVFHTVEEYYDCCGVNNIIDYKILHQSELCCQNLCGNYLINETNVGDMLGCASSIVKKLEKISLESGIFAIIFSVLQIIELASVHLLTMGF